MRRRAGAEHLCRAILLARGGGGALFGVLPVAFQVSFCFLRTKAGSGDATTDGGFVRKGFSFISAKWWVLQVFPVLWDSLSGCRPMCQQWRKPSGHRLPRRWWRTTHAGLHSLRRWPMCLGGHLCWKYALETIIFPYIHG
ncbi:hypothetical protein PVAP13_1NG355100 [Panicum virgatum]|uniref:Uncharacterized protein n=1 Tax=Panicum virgatum TaxID=38727 RepID=A0A8T0WX50_PANVG|nr:hypothetical protein PVAP13_1NG355100 [Panicum virgatum]